MEALLELFSIPLVKSAAVILGSVIVAWVVEVLIVHTLAVAAKKTKTDVDDAIVEVLRRPIFLSVLIYGLDWVAEILTLPERMFGTVESLLQTLIIFIWSLAITRIGSILLHSFSARARERAMLQPRTLPVFEMLMRIVVIAAAIYFIFLAWNIDLTAWLASAGIIGVAFGFAAKDTLANLFSGIFILADGPYKVKDWIDLGGDLRGEVTHIGIRSTRILTPDDVEITVPNAVIGNAQLLNETGGPHIRQRVRVEVAVAYGSDVDRVREVLIEASEDADHILDEPAPRTRFRAMANSGLDFELWVWIDDPHARELVVDDMNERIYKALNAAGIEIPFPKRDIYIRRLPKELEERLSS